MKLFYTNKQCKRDMEITRKWLGFISPDWHLDLDGAYEEIAAMWDIFVDTDDKLDYYAQKKRDELREFREKIIGLNRIRFHSEISE